MSIIVCNTKELTQAVKTVSRAAHASSTAYEILKHAKICASPEGTLTVAATNLVTGLTATVSATAERAVEFTANARQLAEFLGTLPGDVTEIAFDEKKRRATVSSVGVSGMFPSLVPDDFAIVRTAASAEPVGELSIDAQALRRAIGAVVWAAARDETRPALAGVCFRWTGTTLHLFAADGYAAAAASLDLVSGPAPFDRVVDQSAVRELEALLTGATGNVRLILHRDSEVIAEVGATTLAARTIEATYPDLLAVIPKTFGTTVTADRRETMDAIRRARMFLLKDDDVVAVAVTPDHDAGPQMVVSTSRMLEGGSESPVFAEIAGKALEIRINNKYALSSLDAIGGERAVVGLNGATHPVVIRPAEGGQIVHIIMPMVIGAS